MIMLKREKKTKLYVVDNDDERTATAADYDCGSE